MKRAFDIGRTNVRYMNSVGKNVRTFESSALRVDINSKSRVDIPDIMEDFKILEAPRKSLVGKRFIKGESKSYYRGTLLKADNQKLKAEQDETYLNVLYVIARDLACGVSNDEIQLGICIPTAEFYSEGADDLKEEFDGTCTINFPVPDKTVTFTIKGKNVLVTPEGVVAMYPLLKHPVYGKILVRKTGMILDCGQGSLDITIMKSMKPHGDSARSYPTAGMTLESLVSSSLERLGMSSGEDAVEKALSKGEADDGKKTVYIGVMVQQAKKVLASHIKAAMSKSLALATMSIKDINYLAPIGRCFEETGVKGKDNYTGSLIEYIKELWDTSFEVVEVEEIPETTEPEGTEEEPLFASSKKRKRAGELKDSKISRYEAANVLGVSMVLRNNANNG